MLNHSDNYIEANPLSTPAHIVPEWYLLPFYAILRSIPDKIYGIVAMFLSIFLFALLPSVDVKSTVKSLSFKSLYRKVFWFIFFNLLYLGFLGAKSPVSPYVELGLLGTHLHILYFFFIVCILSFFEYSFFMVNTRDYVAIELARRARLSKVISEYNHRLRPVMEHNWRLIYGPAYKEFRAIAGKIN